MSDSQPKHSSRSEITEMRALPRIAFRGENISHICVVFVLFYFSLKSILIVSPILICFPVAMTKILL